MPRSANAQQGRGAGKGRRPSTSTHHRGPQGSRWCCRGRRGSKQLPPWPPPPLARVRRTPAGSTRSPRPEGIATTKRGVASPEGGGGWPSWGWPPRRAEAP
eukprot:9449061-Alexandrium_andersonii.AAC.1